MQKLTTIILSSAAIILSGCGEKKIGFVSDRTTAESCGPGGQRISLDQSGVNTKRLNPGDSTVLRPMLYQGPAIVRGDADCVSKLTITPRNGGTDDDYTLTELEDGRVQFTLSPDVKPGASFTFDALYGNRRRVEDYIAVYDPDKWPLEGIWSQDRKKCGDSAIGELEMSRGGFSVTWRPFESYKDYWGGYTFVADEGETKQGTLTLKTTGGNFMPFGKNDHTLKVKVEGDTLTMVDGNFGPNRGYGVCDQPFKRRSS